MSSFAIRWLIHLYLASTCKGYVRVHKQTACSNALHFYYSVLKWTQLCVQKWTANGAVVVIYLDVWCENDEYIMHCLSNLLSCCPNWSHPPPSLSNTSLLLILAVGSWGNGERVAAVIFAEQVAFLMRVSVMEYSWRGCSSVLFIISYVRQSFRHHLPCLAFSYLVFSIPVTGHLLSLNAIGTLQGNELFEKVKPLV